MWTLRPALRFKRPTRPPLGWWAVVTLCLVASTGFYTDLLRLVNPVGEKYVPSFPPGQNDFSYPYDGARALIAKEDPYHNDRPELTNPIFGVTPIEGIPYKQLYPPGHLLTFVPLALWKGAKWQEAARLWFRFNLASLLGLAVLTWALVRRTSSLRLTPLWIVVLFAALALNPGTELGLERGQSDILMALLCWTSVACFLRGRPGIAIFLALWSTSIKGYPILFTAGLGLLALVRGRWKEALVGVAAAGVVLVLPVARYFGEAAKGMHYRSEMFWPVWFNHGFRNLVYRLAPNYADKGRYALSAFALVVAVVAWLQAWRAAVRSSEAPDEAEEGTVAAPPAVAGVAQGATALWLTLFTTAALGVMLGYSALSVSYNLILILPGTLVLAASHCRFATWLSLPKWAAHVLGSSLLGCVFLLFICRLGDDPPGYEGNIPAAAYGLAMLFPILAALSIRGLARPLAT